MPDLYLVIDLAVVITLLGLGLTVLLKNHYLEINRFFALFVSSISIWIIANYLSNDIHNSYRTALIANYFVFCFSYAAAYFLLRFAISVANDEKSARVAHRLILPSILIALTTFSPFVVKAVKIQGSLYAVKFGWLAPLYFASLLVILGGTLYVLKVNIRRTEGDQKGRLVVLIKTLYATLPLLMLTEFVLPTFTGWFGLTNIGIFSMLILVFGLYYGVVKHRLFDLKLIIVRSLVYVITFGSIFLFYGLASFYITTLISKTHNTVLNEVLNVILIISVVSAYAPLRRLFNRLTNRFFYRDAYDSQSLFDELNKLLVSTLELKVILRQVSHMIASNLKADFCLFTLNETEYSKQRIEGLQKRTLTKHDFEMFRARIPELKNNIVSVDYPETVPEGLSSIMNDCDVAVLIRLSPSASKGYKGSGYILLGAKKSGNPYTKQDLKVLTIIANELIIAIQNALHFEEIQNFNITLQSRVNEATGKLRRANDKLKALDETKDDFISMASHQLRTPLTSIKGYTSMVLEGDAGRLNAMQKKLLTQAFFSSQQMVYLISDLLNISRLKTGKFVVDSGAVNLAEIVEQEFHQLEETAKARSLTLSYEKPKEFPTLMLDETKTRQVIMNFVDNAIYYTPSGGNIRIRLLDKPQTVELRVEDDGIGVPRSEQPHLFTKFYRAPNARKARPDGTGLGLFMAKKVIIAQGGALIFESQEGKGSTFGFTFSKHKAAV